MINIIAIRLVKEMTELGMRAMLSTCPNPIQARHPHCSHLHTQLTLSYRFKHKQLVVVGLHYDIPFVHSFRPPQVVMVALFQGGMVTDRSDLGNTRHIASNSTWFWIPMTLLKYLPWYKLVHLLILRILGFFPIRSILSCIHPSINIWDQF